MSRRLYTMKAPSALAANTYNHQSPCYSYGTDNNRPMVYLFAQQCRAVNDCYRWYHFSTKQHTHWCAHSLRVVCQANDYNLQSCTTLNARPPSTPIIIKNPRKLIGRISRDMMRLLMSQCRTRLNSERVQQSWKARLLSHRPLMY